METHVAGIQERGMLARLSISTWTATKRDPKVSREVIQTHNAKTTAGSFNKKLADSYLLNDFNSLANEARRIHSSYTLPWGDDGSRILPCEMYLKYSHEMNAVTDKMEMVANKIASNLPTIKHHAQIRLGDMYNESDFPTEDELRSKFSIKIHITPIPSSDDWRVQIDEEHRKMLADNLEAEYKSAIDNAMRDTWDRLYQAINKLVERLSNDSNKIHESTLTNALELVDILPMLNITGDADLYTMTEEIRGKIRGADIDGLRKDKALRKNTHEELATFLKKMEAKVVLDAIKDNYHFGFSPKQ